MLCYKKHLAETCQSVFIIPVLTSPRKSAVILLSHIRFLASLTRGNKKHMARIHLAQPSRSSIEAWLSSHTGTKAVLKPWGYSAQSKGSPHPPAPIRQHKLGLHMGSKHLAQGCSQRPTVTDTETSTSKYFDARVETFQFCNQESSAHSSVVSCLSFPPAFPLQSVFIHYSTATLLL